MRYEANRLSDDDRSTIRLCMQSSVSLWREASLNAWHPNWTDLDALVRVGHNAIGCAPQSLRDAELAEIRRMATSELGLES